MRILASILIVCAACGGGSGPATGDASGADGAQASTAVWTAPDIGSIDAVALDATTVYFAYRFGNTDTIYALPKSGGTATPLYQLASGIANGLAVDANHVYYSAGAVYSLPLIGGTPTPVTTTATTAGPLAVDAAYVYFIDTSTGKLSRAPIGGGAIIAVAMSLTAHYWLADTSAVVSTTSTIADQPLSGAQPLQLDAFPSGATIVGLYTDGVTAFATIQDHSSSPFSGYIDSIPLAGGGGSTIYVGRPSTLGEDNRPQISALIGEGPDLYLFSNYTGVNDVAADLVAVPKIKGGAPLTLVAQQTTPMFVAGVDADDVYYVDRKGPNGVEELRRVAR